MTTHCLEKIITDLKEHVARKQRRAAEKYFNSLDAAEWIEGQRAIGARMILDEFGRRFRSAEGLRAEWQERLDPVGDFELRPRLQPGRADLPLPALRRRKIA